MLNCHPWKHTVSSHFLLFLQGKKVKEKSIQWDSEDKKRFQGYIHSLISTKKAIALD